MKKLLRTLIKNSIIVSLLFIAGLVCVFTTTSEAYAEQDLTTTSKALDYQGLAAYLKKNGVQDSRDIYSYDNTAPTSQTDTKPDTDDIGQEMWREELAKVAPRDNTDVAPIIPESPPPFCSDKEVACYPACKYSPVEDCTLCPLFAVVFNTVSHIGSISAERFSDSVMTLVVVFFGIWLTIEVLKYVSSMKTKDLKDFAQLLVNRGFIVLLVLAILKSGVGNFYNVFIQPVYNTGQNMAQIMFASPNSKAHPDDKQASKDPAVASIKEYKDGLPVSMGTSIVKTMTMMENRIRKIMALGSSMMCYSWQKRWFIFPKFKYLMFGMIVYFLSISMLVIVPFLLIDAVFQLGVATTLMPFAVGAYAFDYTRKHCKKVFDTFLNSAFSFLFISVIVLILLGAIQSTVEGGTKNISDFDKMFNVGNNYFTTFAESVSWGSGFVLNLFFVFLLAWSVMNMGKEFADKFASSIDQGGIGSKIGGTLGSMATNMAKKGAAPIAKATSRGIKSGVKRVGRGIYHGVQRLRYMKKKNKFKDVKPDANGNKTYTDKKGRIHTMDSNGNITVQKPTKIKHSRDGNTKKVIKTKTYRTSSAIITQKTTTTYKKVDIKDKDGKIIGSKWVVKDVKVSEKMKFIKEDASKLMKKNGEISQQAMNELLNGTTGEVREALKRNALRQITEARFSKVAFDPNNTKLSSPPETTVDPKTGEVITKYVTASGEVIITKSKLRSDGLLESKLTRVTKSGKVINLESDGIRNKMTIRLLNEGVDPSSLNSIDDIENNCRKTTGVIGSINDKDQFVDEQGNTKNVTITTDADGRKVIKDENDNIIGYLDKDGNVMGEVFLENVGYQYTDYYKHKLQTGEIRESDISDGMFGYAIVRDSDGNIIGGSFQRYRSGADSDTLIHWKDLNFRSWGSSRSARDDRALNQGHLFKRGNNYDIIEGDMNLYFGGAGSSKRAKNIFGTIRGR